MFHKRLESLLKTAVERQIVTTGAAEQLRDLAREQEKDRGALTLASVFGWLGGSAVVIGLILLIASNWDGISDGLKLAGFFVLLAGTHGLGFWLTKSGLPYERTAASFHFIGAGLVLAGIGLVAQIYHLNGRPPNAFLLWLGAILPLAVLLRSATIGVMSLFAFMVWVHLEGSFRGSPFYMPDELGPHLVLELGVGAGLVGFSGLLKKAEPRLASALRGCGALMLFGSIYLLGFYRYFGPSEWRTTTATEGSALLPMGVLALAAVGLAVGGRHLSPESVWLRNRLLALMVATLVLGAGIVALETGVIPIGPKVEFFEFGWSRHHGLTQWVLTVVSWFLWFILGLWCVAWGARSDHKGFVNLGVLAVGAGIVTRFFDLMGSMAQTGTMFLIGGVVLLGTGFGMERWRRKIVRQMLAGKAVSS
jgi:uncharacterized membrane protein